MEHSRTPTPHQYQRIDGGTQSDSDIYKNTQSSFYTHVDRQHNSTQLPQQHGRTNKSNHEQLNQANMGLSAQKQNPMHSRIYPIQTQCRGRRGVQNNRLQRMETQYESFRQNLSKFRRTRHRSICITSITPDSKILQLQTRSKSTSSRCFPTRLEAQTNICLSPFQSHRENTEKGTKPAIIHDHNYTNMEHTTILAPSTADGDRTTNPTPKHLEPNTRPSGKQTSITSQRKTQTSGLASLRKSLQAEGVSQQASYLIENSRARGTISAYDSAWKKFDSWCKQRQVDPIHCNVTYILDFLESLYNKGLQYGTINNYRSAISAYHAKIDGDTAGNHHRVCSLLTGVSNLRPPKPIQTSVWNVETVIKYFKTLPDTFSQTVMQTTLKTVTLLALASSARSNEIHKLDLEWLTDFGNKMVFQIPGRVKHSRQGKVNPPITFVEFPQDPNLCPVKSLRTYINMTKPWRNQQPNSCLFLTTVSPHRPAAKATVANWVKKTLTLAGIQGFTAHSTRAASSSKANSKGIPLQTILQRGNWRSSNVWEKHYHKQVVEQAEYFQKAVLS